VDHGKDRATAADELVARNRSLGVRIPGFGHTTFVGGDPRVPRLLAVADECGLNGKNIANVRELEYAIERNLGRHLPLNVTGAIAACLLEAGLPWESFRGFALISRTAALVVHAAGEREESMIPESLSALLADPDEAELVEIEQT
jgi:citrate synthase